MSRKDVFQPSPEKSKRQKREYSSQERSAMNYKDKFAVALHKVFGLQKNKQILTEILSNYKKALEDGGKTAEQIIAEQLLDEKLSLEEVQDSPFFEAYRFYRDDIYYELMTYSDVALLKHRLKESIQFLAACLQIYVNNYVELTNKERKVIKSKGTNALLGYIRQHPEKIKENLFRAQQRAREVNSVPKIYGKELRSRIRDLLSEDRLSYQEIADKLNEEGYSKSNGTLFSSTDINSFISYDPENELRGIRRRILAENRQHRVERLQDAYNHGKSIEEIRDLLRDEKIIDTATQNYWLKAAGISYRIRTNWKEKFETTEGYLTLEELLGIFMLNIDTNHVTNFPILQDQFADWLISIGISEVPLLTKVSVQNKIRSGL